MHFNDNRDLNLQILPSSFMGFYEADRGKWWLSSLLTFSVFLFLQERWPRFPFATFVPRNIISFVLLLCPIAVAYHGSHTRTIEKMKDAGRVEEFLLRIERICKVARVYVKLISISPGSMHKIRKMLNNIRLDRITLISQDFDLEERYGKRLLFGKWSSKCQAKSHANGLQSLDFRCCNHNKDMCTEWAEFVRRM